MTRFAFHYANDITIHALIDKEKKIFTGIILLFFLFAFAAQGAYAQEVRNLDEYLVSLKATKSPASEADGERLYSLVYDLHPILFITNGEIKNPLGGKPICLTTDAGSIDQLYEPLSTYNSIELITIIIKEKGNILTKLELDKLQSFTSLRHVYFMSKSELCDTPDPVCEAQFIADIISGTDRSDIQVLYKVVTSN